MAELLNQGVSIERSKTAELSKIKGAIADFQETVLSIGNPDNLTLIEQEKLAIAGDELITKHGWPLARVFDLYYGMRPDATKLELPTESVAGMMVAADENNKFHYWDREANEDCEPTGLDPFSMLFGQRGFVDMDKLLPHSRKRSPLPNLK